MENAGIIGLEDVQVVESDGTRLVAVQRLDLDLDSTTDTRARELALLDNRTAEVNLDWDADIIAALQDEGLDLSAAFSDQELDLLAGAAEDVSQVVAPEQFVSVDESLSTAYQCPKCGYEWSGKPK